jgi:hypothetical protein
MQNLQKIKGPAEKVAAFRRRRVLQPAGDKIFPNLSGRVTKCPIAPLRPVVLCATPRPASPCVEGASLGHEPRCRRQ